MILSELILAWSIAEKPGASGGFAPPLPPHQGSARDLAGGMRPPDPRLIFSLFQDGQITCLIMEND